MGLLSYIILQYICSYVLLGFFFYSKPKRSFDELLKLSKSQDPFKLVDKDITTLADGIKELLGSDHPVLETCAK